MPATYDIQPEKGLILTACLGEISFDEIVSCVAACHADRRYRREHHGVSDVRDATFAFGEREARALAREIGSAANRSSGKWAFLIDAPRATALVLVFGSERDPETPIRVFTTPAAAGAWLGVDVSDEELLAVRAANR